MNKNLSLKANNLDFNLSTPEEIASELANRLRRHRLMSRIKQIELAEKAGLSTGTIKNLESKGQCSLESLIRISIALNLADDLASLFRSQPASIADMEELEKFSTEKLPMRVRSK